MDYFVKRLLLSLPSIGTLKKRKHSPEAMLTAHTSVWTKLEQTDYEKWQCLWG